MNRSSTLFAVAVTVVTILPVAYFWPIVWLWGLCIVIVCFPIYYVIRSTWAMRSICYPKIDVGVCPKCGYDLRASSKRCPECGTPAPTQNPAAPATRQRQDSRADKGSGADKGRG